MTNTANTDARPAPLATFNEAFEKRGAWYTHLETGEKARGLDAAQELFTRINAAAVDAITLAADDAEADAETFARNSDFARAEAAAANSDRVYFDSYEHALTFPVGSRIFANHANIPTASGKATFKTDQPVTVYACSSCGALRAVHLQDLPQTGGLCLDCIKAARRVRANEAAKAKRAAARAEKEDTE